jgi:hypothetical protein
MHIMIIGDILNYALTVMLTPFRGHLKNNSDHFDNFSKYCVFPPVFIGLVAHTNIVIETKIMFLSFIGVEL